MPVAGAPSGALIMTAPTLRPWAIRWLYGAIAAHLIVGLLLPWLAGSALFEGYHAAIEASFYGGATPAAARAQQLWWMALFGPTVQAAAIWMGALVWLGAHARQPFAWGALIAGLLLWAPQDMLVSLRADCWSHVWLDAFALAAMLPPLAWLFFTDRAHIQGRSTP
jgi:hypothetical protein